MGAFVCLLDFANDNLDKPAIILYQLSRVHMMREGELGVFRKAGGSERPGAGGLPAGLPRAAGPARRAAGARPRG